MPYQILTFLREWWPLVAMFFFGSGVSGAGAVAYINLWYHRKIPSAEVHRTHSEAELNEAKARDIDRRGSVHITETLMRMVKLMETLESRVEEKNYQIQMLEAELEHYKEEQNRGSEENSSVG